MYTIGIDLGTSSVKAVLMDEAGGIAAAADRAYENLYPQPGWTEQDPETWFVAAIETLEKLLRGDPRRAAEVAGIAITGQMHTTVFLDASGASLRPAILWNDLRTADQAARLKAAAQNMPQIQYLQNILSTGSPACNLLWLKENEPQHFARIHKFLIAKDYLVYRLTGAFVTDYCDASTSSLYDLRARVWSDDMAAAIGLSPAVFPEVKASAACAGRINPQIAWKLGLGADVAVAVGTGDNPATALAAGVADGGLPVLSLGSSGVFCAACAAPVLAGRAKNILFAVDPGHIAYLVQGAVQSAGLASAWFTEQILQTEDYRAEQEPIRSEELGRNETLFFPHLRGDKLVFGDPNLRGAFLGLGIHTKRRHMTQAVLEGVAFALRDALGVLRALGIDIRAARLAGGGAKSELWRQILADVLGIALHIPAADAGAAYGAALLAARACGLCENPRDLAAANQTTARVVEPGVRAALYETQYARYKKIAPALRAVYDAETLKGR